MQTYETDIVIIGGGLGGVAAALAALTLGKRVILTEEYEWLGGQLTSQAVPPDEHSWIETMGCTASYRHLRNGIRAYYRQHYPLTAEAAADPYLNPGQGIVSRLCHEPRVALAVLESMLAPYRVNLQLQVFLQTRPVAATCSGDHVREVQCEHVLRREQCTLLAPYILDATELGDLLPLTGTEHMIGSESQAQTGELHALPGEADPLDQQAISWCFALDYLPGEDHTIERPVDYDFWRSYRAAFWPAQQLSWTDCNPVTLRTRTRSLFERPVDNEHDCDLWHYRRIFARAHYPAGRYPSDMTLVNWPQIDYWLGPLVGVSEEEKQRNLHQAAQLSRSMLYWMQTEAPRHDGGVGYPEVRLRGDLLGTDHGLAQFPYIRESRRIRAERTVCEQDLGVQARKEAGLPPGAEQFADSVGIGYYRIDLHPSTGLRTYVDISSYPFQIPLGALIPIRMENLLPACKNLGVTHITNGCYRLHPVEWTIGEAAGALAAYCLQHQVTPRQVSHTSNHLADFQTVLTDTLGFELVWPKEIQNSAQL